MKTSGWGGAEDEEKEGLGREWKLVKSGGGKRQDMEMRVEGEGRERVGRESKIKNRGKGEGVRGGEGE